MNNRKTARPESSMQVQSPGEKTGKILNREIQAKIGQQLRAVYNDVVEQGVPTRFAELLSRLDSDSEANDQQSDKETQE